MSLDGCKGWNKVYGDVLGPSYNGPGMIDGPPCLRLAQSDLDTSCLFDKPAFTKNNRVSYPVDVRFIFVKNKSHGIGIEGKGLKCRLCLVACPIKCDAVVHIAVIAYDAVSSLHGAVQLVGIEDCAYLGYVAAEFQPLIVVFDHDAYDLVYIIVVNHLPQLGQ